MSLGSLMRIVAALDLPPSWADDTLARCVFVTGVQAEDRWLSPACKDRAKKRSDVVGAAPGRV